MTATKIEELEDMARECRALASTAAHEMVREEILEIAERFEQRAQRDRQVSGQTFLASARSSSRRL
jgi:hypothetical protein